MQEAILVDLGALVITQPRLSAYLEQAGISETDPIAWDYILAGLRYGTVRPRILEGVEDAVCRLAKYYALACFGDGPDEFTKFCLDELPVRKYFPQELVIPNSILSERGKKNPQSWTGAADYLLARNLSPVACIDDDFDAVRSCKSSEIGIEVYYVQRDLNISRYFHMYPDDPKNSYKTVRGLREMANDFLQSRVKKP